MSKAMKEVRFSPNIGVHDLRVKENQIRKFLTKGLKVRVSVQFHGREKAHMDLGKQLLQTIVVTIIGARLAHQDYPIRDLGGSLDTTLTPPQKKQPQVGQ